MVRWLLLVSICCLVAGSARASPLSPTPIAPGEQCRSAIAAAERGHGIPPQLLAAIGRVESGRRDPGNGTWAPWPWTINAEGQGAFFDTKAEAIQAVQALQARGVRSIDVGCMQVNLMHHPAAFPNLDLAFEPAVNADYAARFLVELHEQTGDWAKATADYHSANPEEGGPYAAKVISVWPEEQRRVGTSPPVQLSQSAIRPFPASLPPLAPRLYLYAMAGVPPLMMPPGSVPPAPLSGRTASPEPGSGQRVGIPGRDLNSYRATPIRMATPVRAMLRLPPLITR